MGLFLLLWLLNAGMLAASLGVLRPICRVLGAHSGLKGWKGEIPTVIVAALVFTLVGNGIQVFGANDPTGRATVALFALGLFAIGGIYKVTHLLEMDELQPTLISVLFAGIRIFIWGLFLKVLREAG